MFYFLGGKSYAPGEEHPFFEFQAQILELVKLVESAQTKVESIKDPETAVQKVPIKLDFLLLFTFQFVHLF